MSSITSNKIDKTKEEFEDAVNFEFSLEGFSAKDLALLERIQGRNYSLVISKLHDYPPISCEMVDCDDLADFLATLLWNGELTECGNSPLDKITFLCAEHLTVFRKLFMEEKC
jgi:hypothetical protein